MELGAENLEIDFADPDDSNIFRARLREILYAPVFEGFIAALIILNAIVLGAMTYRYSSDAYDFISLMLRIDIMIIIIFVCEIALKIYADGLRFFKNGWNVFDFLVVALGAVGTGYPLTVIRSLRVLRIFRLVRRVPSMRVVVESFLKSIPGIGSVLFVILLVLFVFSVIGVGLFGNIAPDLFGNLQASAFTLFTVLTLEGWPEVSREVMAFRPWSWIFFVLYIGINSFVALNLMIAVIINAMQKDYEEEAEDEREDILREVQALRAEVKQLLAMTNSR